MAPVACVADFPMPRTDAAYPYTVRRQRNRFALKFVEKYRTDEMGQMSIARGRVEAPHDTAAPSSRPISVSDASRNTYYRNNELAASYSNDISIEQAENWIILKRRAGLLNVIARTLDLVRRNHILEKKVEALKLQTRSFVNSIHNNREKTSVDVRHRASSFHRDVEMEDSLSSTVDEQFSSRSRSIALKESTQDSKKNISKGQNDRDPTISSLERESQSTNTMVH